MAEGQRIEVPWHGEVAGAVATAAWNAATAFVREHDAPPVRKVTTDPAGSVGVAGLEFPQAAAEEAAKEALLEHHADELPERFEVVKVSIEVEGESWVTVVPLEDG